MTRRPVTGDGSQRIVPSSSDEGGLTRLMANGDWAQGLNVLMQSLAHAFVRVRLKRPGSIVFWGEFDLRQRV
jgi:hypothetical protein